MRLILAQYEQRGRQTLVVFDEFQDVLAAGDRTDAVIRSEIEHHGKAASYLFAGSHVGMMRELFADKRRAFYGQAGPVDLGPLPVEAVAEYVDGRFRAFNRDVGEALGPLLDLAAGHPQRTMLLAHHLFAATPPRRAATAQTWAKTVDRVIEVEVRDELRALWNGLTTGQQRVLVAIAENTSPLFGADTQRRVGGSRGGSLRAPLQALLDLGELVEQPGTRTGYRVVDPLLALWVREGRHEH